MKKALLGLLLTSTITLAACGGGSSESESENQVAVPDGATEIRFLNGFTGGDGEFMRKITDGFNESQDDYFINEMQEPEHYTQFRTGEYDMVVMHGVNLDTYKQDQMIQPIDSVMETAGLSLEDFHPASEDLVVFDEGTYGIPLDIHPLTTFYNKELTEEAPATYEELAALSSELQAKDESLYAMGVPDTGLVEFYTLTIAAQNNVDLLSEDGTYLNFAQEELADALFVYHDMIYKDNISPAGLATDGEFQAFMQQTEEGSTGDQTAVALTGPWYYAAVRDAYGDNLGIGSIPKLGDEVAVYGNSHVISLPSNVEDENVLEGISAFFEYMYQPEVLANWADSGQAPLHTETMNYIEENQDQYPLSYQNQQMFDDYVAAPQVYQYGEQIRYMNETVFGRLVREEDITKEELMEELEIATDQAKQISETAPAE